VDWANSRLASVADPAARGALQDALWAGGSKYAWVRAAVLEADVTRTEHAPGGDAVRRETWRLDLVTGRVDLSRPDEGYAAACEPGGPARVSVSGRPADDPEALLRAALDARLVRELAAMPLSLLVPGVHVTYVGTRTGPGMARTWRRLLATYGPGSGGGPADRTVVEVRERGDRIDAVLVEWAAYPLLGRPVRVLLDDWRPAGDVLVARRWRFEFVEADGRPAGPVTMTLTLDRVTVE
jgi:hypothetical protein